MNPIAVFIRTLGPARIGAIGALTAIILGIVVFGYIRASTPTMRPLFTDLEFDDSSAIVRDLESENIPYEMRGDGSTILVPSDMVLRLRMQLAENGLPVGGGVGYEIFDRGDGLGATSFVQNLNHLRALEGELARTIRTIDRVRAARVHLVLPERRLFNREEAQPSASIVLKLRGPLASGQIKAIQHLVAAGVKGMVPDRVSVVDDRGDLLASGMGDDQMVLNSSLEERRLAIEQRLQRQVEAIVTSVVGAGNARVQISAELDNRRVTETEDIFDPEGQVVRSTQTREEETNAVDQTQSGGVSASNELPGASASNEGGGTKEATTANEEVINYEISKRSTTEVREAGGIKRLSVAVLVDGLYEKDANGDATYSPRPQEQIDQIAQLVRPAIGFDRERGDTVEVVNLQFAPAAAEATFDDAGGGFLSLTTNDYLRIAELVVLALVGMILVLFVVRPLLNRVLSSEGAIAGRLAAPLGEMAQQNSDGTAFDGQAENRALPAPAGPGKVEEMIDIAKVTGQVQESTVKKIGEMVRDNPEETASILRQWLHQEA